MSLFAEILWKQLPDIEFPSVDSASVNKLNISWKYNTLHHTAIRLIYHIYFLPYNNKQQYTDTQSFVGKFNILDIIVLNNKQLGDMEKNYFIAKFMVAQKIYSSFRKLAQIFRYKYGKKFPIDADLCFTQFSNFKHSILLSLIEDKILYKFRISDLINIINKSLSHAPMFFAEPMTLLKTHSQIYHFVSLISIIYILN